MSTISLTASNGLLRAVLATLRYKRGWSFELHGEAGPALFLQINVETADSTYRNNPGDAVKVTDLGLMVERARITHRFPLPIAPPLDMDWPKERIEDWVFYCIVQVERHEAGEFFEVDGDRPFLPPHGEGVDPYEIRRRS